MERVNPKKREPNILILGASGNIGSYLYRKIAKEKFSVISTTFSSKKIMERAYTLIYVIKAR